MDIVVKQNNYKSLIINALFAELITCLLAWLIFVPDLRFVRNLVLFSEMYDILKYSRVSWLVACLSYGTVEALLLIIIIQGS